VAEPTFVLGGGPPALAGQVLGYCGYVEDGPPIGRREPAGTRGAIHLSFGVPLTVQEGGGGRAEGYSFVAGV
jgi:hypothetical protein